MRAFGSEPGEACGIFRIDRRNFARRFVSKQLTRPRFKDFSRSPLLLLAQLLLLSVASTCLEQLAFPSC